MIGLDTNILIRFLTQDDVRQSPIANRILEERITKDDPGFVSVVTMVEIAWVLESQFELSRAEVAALIDGLLRIETIVVQHRNLVLRALDQVRVGQADFADALTGALCAEAGCDVTLTFDRRASRLKGFELAV